MRKRQFSISDEERRELVSAYTQSKEGGVRTRLQAVRLYGSGYRVEEVLGITGCSRTSLLEWCQAYRESGVQGLHDHRLGGNSAKLSAEQIAELAGKLRQYTPKHVFDSQATSSEGQFWSVADLQRAVKQWYGVVYQSRSSYHRLFALCRFSYQRTEHVYASRREADVSAFEEALEKN